MAHEEKKPITPGMTVIEVMTLLAEGNPGAAGALVTLYQNAAQIDPRGALGGFGPLMQLDNFGIRGTDIYILHNDICERNVARTLLLLRATQLGFSAQEVLRDACARQDRTGKTLFDLPALYAQVKQRLPEFDPQNLAKLF